MSSASTPSNRADTPRPAGLETVVREFEAACLRGEHPDIDAALAPLTGEERAAALVELAHAELELRLKAGEPARVENYLRRYPELTEQPGVIVGLIEAEYKQRAQSESALTYAEYLARFPALVSRLPTRAQTMLAAGAGHDGTAVPSDDGSGFDLRDCELLDRVGRGGMGEVFRGKDPALGRDLAVKVLRPELRSDPGAERRFAQEARVTGALQHPNIVPVHNLGRLPDGRLYFTMKLVRGRTLAEMLAEGQGPGRLAEWLGVFEKVCQAVAFAHSRGVIHRDLKPANVMVGAFGEVQVMDWGLAKVLALADGVAFQEGESGEAGDTVRRVALTGSTADDRRTGIVGTPAYMAPEQARGEADVVDERADVFGMGAILCEILTGRPPHWGTDLDAILREAASGDTADAYARLDGCGADPQLVQLAKACLAPEPAWRPRDASSVAVAVTAYQHSVQERLRQAELGRAAEQARAEAAQARARAEQRARRLTAGLAVAGLALVVGLAAGGLWWQRQRAALRQDAEARLEQAARLRQGSQFEESRALLDQARQRLEAGGPDDLREAVNRALAETALTERFDAARQRASILVDGRLDYVGAQQDYAAAWHEAGLGAEGEDAAAVGERVRASAVRAELVAALDSWAGIAADGARLAWLLGVSRAADPDSLRDRLRQPGLWRDKAALARLTEEVRVGELSPQLASALGLALLRSEGDAVPLLREAQSRHPQDFWLNFELGVALRRAKEWDQAIGYYRAALALRPRNTTVHAELGAALYDQGKRLEAINYFEQALHLDPNDVRAHVDLGVALNAQGKSAEAIGHFEQALRLDPKDARAHNGLGVTLSGQGKRAEAIGHFEQARRLDEQALRLDPKDAHAHVNLGLALSRQGKREEAIGHLEEALRLDPKNITAHFNLGIALSGQGRLAEAIGHYEQVLRLDPKDVQAHVNLGAVLKDTGRLAEAIGHYEQALRLEPKNTTAHFNLGIALSEQGKREEAIGHLEEALRLDPKYAKAHYSLGVTLSEQGRLAEAVGHFEQALRLDPKDVQAHVNLGAVLNAQGKSAEAIGHFEQAIALAPREAIPRGALAQALMAQGRWAEARNATRRCLELLPPRHPQRALATQLLQECEQMPAVDQKLAAVLRGEAEPGDAAERIALGQLCQQYKRWHSTAARFYADAFTADPKLAEDLRRQFRYSAACSAALAAAGQAADARDLPDKVSWMLRHQALRWLRADLALYAKHAEDAAAKESVRQRLAHWQQDSDLATVRDKSQLDRLPEDERTQWRALWDEVDRILRVVREAGAPARQ
jgi:serine/threonine-protein kinase